MRRSRQAWSYPLCLFLLLLCFVEVLWSSSVLGKDAFDDSASSSSQTPSSLELTADQIEFTQTTQEYHAVGSVVLTQDALRLTADEATIHKLSGQLTAEGHVHLRDLTSDVWSEHLVLNVNTEQGLITNGRLHFSESNAWVSGRFIQRFSETHYRAKDGSFTTCHADEGEVPDWRLTFDDIDMEQGDSVFAKGVWLEVLNQPIFPLPVLRYPLPGARKSGFLVPTVGVDNVFGFQYRQAFYWALSPSQDVTITPQILSDRGFGSDLEYRYILNRRSRGKWLINALQDTEEKRTRAQITGTHVQQPTRDLSIRVKVNYATDRSLLKDLSNSSVFRALPSQESLLTMNQRLDHGDLSFRAQYLQPLDSGGKQTFQRLPELGYRVRDQKLGNTPLVMGMQSTAVHFFREEGFDVSRADFLPSLSLERLHLGHIVGLRPRVKLREVVYSHGRRSTQNVARTRETLWAALEARSSLARHFSLADGTGLRHAIEPKVIYEYVPRTKQSDLAQIDGVDNLIKKNLLTYSLNTRLMEESQNRKAKNSVDLLLAQSYHLEGAPGQAKALSDIWGRLSLNGPAQWIPSVTDMSLAVDSFIDPNKSEFSQVNADLQLRGGTDWYLKVGHRHTRSGLVARRGDIWNPISFNEVLSPRDKIEFFTASGAIRAPFGWTVGAKVFHDFATGQTPEWDVVGLYQNPCQCWSLGLYYIQLDGDDGVEQRNQFNFVLTLRGLGVTPGVGTQVIKSILNPLLGKEAGLPWAPL
ncbi:MAG: LPS assembly protein LptD [Nitrospirales bacterium]|nr:LPS assembly protein LptD [Nitrospirales bacterium]